VPDGEVEHGGWRGFLFGHVVCLLEKDLFPMQSNENKLSRGYRRRG
jgi:hypothetical protein